MDKMSVLLPILLTLLHSEWPKLHRVLAILNAIELRCFLDVIKQEILMARCCGSYVLNPSKDYQFGTVLQKLLQ